ncbi:O-antigen ligase family protein [Paenibacillus hodogayensis]|uniref:O-antigen ligase family protein n=1 Tax=Paenibacillus hodogayensis TaxID=279208 RepID=A0ABV5W8E9_9BACL
MTSVVWLFGLVSAVFFFIVFLTAKPEFVVIFLLFGKPLTAHLIAKYGIPVPDIGVNLAVTIPILLNLIVHRKLGRLFNPIMYISLLLLCWLWIGLLYVPPSSVGYGTAKFIYIIAGNLLVGATTLILFKDQAWVNSILKAMYVTGWIFTVWGLIELIGKDFSSLSRFSPSYYNPIEYSRVIGLSVLCAIFLGESRNEASTGKLRNRGRIVHIIIGLLLMGLTGSKGPIIALVVAILLFNLAKKRRISGAKLFKIAMVSFCTIALLLAALPNQIKDRLLFEDNSGEGSVASRVDLLTIAVKGFEEKPLIGGGTGSFADFFTGARIYPHNIFAELATENGAIGLLLFIVFLGYIFWIIRRAFASTRDTDTLNVERVLLSAAAAITIYYLITMQFSFDMQNASGIWFGAALAYSLTRMIRTSSRTFQYGG